MDIKRNVLSQCGKSFMVAAAIACATTLPASANLLSDTVDKGTQLLDALTGSSLPPSMFSESVSVSAGPVPLPSVPVQVCVGDRCAETPELSSVALKVSVGFGANSTPPLIIPGACPAGQTGLALSVVTSSGSAVLAVDVSGAVGDMEFSRVVGPLDLGTESRTVTVSACST